MIGQGLFIARPLSGTVGETQRVVHLFPVPTDEPIPEELAALCDARFGRGDLEGLSRVTGAPCEVCLSRAPSPAGELPTAADNVAERLTAIEHLVERLAQQIEDVSASISVLRRRRRLTDRELLDAARRAEIRLRHLYTDLFHPGPGQADEMRHLADRLTDLAQALVLRASEWDA
ncbi:hypothetical protein [Amycolatopsis nigrescens]|uniref:hypothetical protein n=1 Tax=Amycolatopsis nigrescens TaxID=381445 RepID=UPI00036D2CFA